MCACNLCLRRQWTAVRHTFPELNISLRPWENSLYFISRLIQEVLQCMNVFDGVLKIKLIYRIRHKCFITCKVSYLDSFFPLRPGVRGRRSRSFSYAKLRVFTLSRSLAFLILTESDMAADLERLRIFPPPSSLTNGSSVVTFHPC